MVPVIAWCVADAPGRIGWQMTALILGIGTAVLAVPLASLLRNDPKDYGAVPDGGPQRAPATRYCRRLPRSQPRPASRN